MTRLPESLARYGKYVQRTKGRVVVSAIFGSYDRLTGYKKSSDEDVKFICFTDNSAIGADGWEVVEVTDSYRDPRRTAKIFKVFSTQFFPCAEAVMWIDGSCYFKRSPLKLFSECSYRSLWLYNHPDRICLYREAEVCASMGKDERGLLEEQCKRYRIAGFPEKFGLYATGCNVKPVGCSEIDALMLDWWMEIDRGSVRDQISFPYVLWKRPVKVGLISGSIFKSDTIGFNVHKRFRFYDRQGHRINKTLSFFGYLKLRLFLFAAKIKNVHKNIRKKR